MTTVETPNSESPTPQTTLLAAQTASTPSDIARGYLRRLASGDIGSLPILIGLVIIAIIFQSRNPNFLTARNFTNLITQMAGITVMAYGVVFVLLLGEIDLSIGFVGAVAGVSVAMLLRDPSGTWQWYTAIPLALVGVALIGLLHGLIITFFRVPSFIVTLAGLIGWNGVVLHLIGTGGTVIIQDKVVIGIANSYLPDVIGWVVGAVLVLGYAYMQFSRYNNRKRQGLAPRPVAVIVIELLVLAAATIIFILVCDQDRGVPVVGLILLLGLLGLTYLAQNTPFGRYVYAVGGNAEAARRAGINVTRIRILVFIMSSLLTGVGGIILASRLRSVDTNAGGGNLLLNAIASAVIGGTSLFGGRGFVGSAILGALIIAGIDNGMGLLNVSSGDKFIITGIVLIIAVVVDALSRRRQQQSGIA